MRSVAQGWGEFLGERTKNLEMDQLVSRLGKVDEFKERFREFVVDSNVDNLDVGSDGGTYSRRAQNRALSESLGGFV